MKQVKCQRRFFFLNAKDFTAHTVGFSNDANFIFLTLLRSNLVFARIGLHTWNRLTERVQHDGPGVSVIKVRMRFGRPIKASDWQFRIIMLRANKATLNCLLIDSNRLGLIAKNTIESGQIPSSR